MIRLGRWRRRVPSGVYRREAAALIKVVSSVLSTRTSLLDDVVHGEEGVDEREGRAGALGCGRDADGLRVYINAVF